MLSVVLAPFAASLLAPFLVARLGDRAALVLALVPAALFGWALANLGEAYPGRVEATPWVPGLSVPLSFNLDGLSSLFTLLITGIGTLVVLYAGGYLKGHARLGRFFVILFGFMGSMLGVVLSDNVITLFVFWELTSLTSYLLVGFEAQKPEARRSALQALLITGTGGLCLLAGLILLAEAGGSWELSDLALSRSWLQDSPLYVPALILILLGCFTKSAQWPFHSWLPGAMAAPTPVSAYLHSATMVKAGVYLLARLEPALAGSEIWLYSLLVIGAVTMLTGAVFALLETDLKLVLAWTTVSALGTLVFLLAPSDEPSVKAAMAFLLVHALYKGALFMTAGNIDHEAGTRDLTRLSGLARVMPLTFAAAAMASLSMAGLPIGLGWVAKELIGTAKLADDIGFTLTSATIANAMVFAVAGIAALSPYLGKRSEAAEHAHEAPWTMLAGPLVLGALGLVFGMLPQLAADALITPAAAAVLGQKPVLAIAIFKGVDWKFLLTLATFAAGAVIYLLWRRFGAAWRDASAPILARGPDRGYDRLLAGLASFATWLTRLMQPGVLHRYVGASFVVVALIVLASAFRGRFTLAMPSDGGLVVEWAVILLTGAAAIVTALATTRLLAVTALGVVGLGVTMIFMVFSAPDLAITQFMVETLVVVILALVLIRLPGFQLGTPQQRQGPAALLLAVAVGTGTALLLLGVLAEPFDTRLAEWFAAESVPGGQGRNVVNVILVDFRALDTLGEITVVAAAALGGLAAMMRVGRRRADAPPQSNLGEPR
ncbi:hydrogen gas-evolving membrane-bound hydrogenase subunit E [Elioraea rosea]|uniref:hydrogen gas-evolving membrane-bound hydrogenase subunit E n=1 Tax=Elioraea rosea TaxID=2492390 RepID=UPI00118682CE|nr:hydrogen gas-evolving membrane-bound hydrogenase subunit E [Elioraea rosea]